MCGGSETCEYKQHLEKNKIYHKEYYNNNKDKIKKTLQEYYQDNKEHIKEIQKLYKLNNKDNLQKFYNEKHTCDCGGKYTSTNKSRHILSKKHIAWMNKSNGQGISEADKEHIREDDKEADTEAMDETTCSSIIVANTGSKE